MQGANTPTFPVIYWEHFAVQAREIQDKSPASLIKITDVCKHSLWTRVFTACTQVHHAMFVVESSCGGTFFSADVMQKELSSEFWTTSLWRRKGKRLYLHVPKNTKRRRRRRRKRRRAHKETPPGEKFFRAPFTSVHFAPHPGHFSYEFP